jgi:Histidine kinase-, DNA gyrase B-, and HSP90-like ATPase
LPFGYEETRLWRESLGARENDSYQQARAQLAAAYHGFRERAAPLAAEIPIDLAEFTVHDVTHLDALWELADIIGGDDVTLTPTEAFVLGGAFLIHDLGMGLAAWPGGLDDLMKEEGWDDVLAGALTSLLGRQPERSELSAPSTEALRIAKENALRERHALHAAELALISWKSTGTGANYHLIDNVDLRNNYGRLIGEIAASHWWDIDQVADRFPGTTIGAPVTCPDEWTVDALKLACLMRCADAAHLDARRAPGFLRAVRKPSPYSDLHWKFQGYLQRPRLENDRMVYTSVRPFELQDAPAWWLAFESIEMVDGELRKVDALLADRGKSRFRARSVKGADNPKRLAELVPTIGWNPIDARVTVSNVPGLVRSLGGANLYGDSPKIALRELIQNARDATRALAALHAGNASAITISLREEAEGWWLSVTDCGIGMSEAVMTGALLDFGRSYWGSYLMRRETPGLGASEFAAAGRYGIGFYSVFMLGDDVRVTSRRFDDASVDTRVLEFADGLSARPILRPARQDEIRHSGGTSVAVRLRIDPYSENGLLNQGAGALDMHLLCGNLAPALDCDLAVQVGAAAAVSIVGADDWLTLPGETLIRRLSDERRDGLWGHAEVSLDEVAARLRPLVVGGKTVGRVSLAPSPPAASQQDGSVLDLQGVAVVGGLRSATLGGIVGVVDGVPQKADRASADLLVTASTWKEWATEQADLWADDFNRHPRYDESQISVGLLVRLGADTGRIELCHNNLKYVTAAEIIEWAKGRDTVIAVDGFAFDCELTTTGFSAWGRYDHEFVELGDDVLRIGTPGRYGGWEAFGDEHPDRRWAPADGTRTNHANPFQWWHDKQLDIETRILSLVAEGWGCSLEDILRNLTHFAPDFAAVEVGKNEAGEVVEELAIHWVAHRPSASVPAA